MSKTSDVRLISVTSDTESVDYRTPIKFGGRVVEETVLMNVTVDVETRDGRRARGYVSMPMGNVWSWPTDEVPPADTLSALVDLAERVVREAQGHTGFGHPLEITHELMGAHGALAEAVVGDAGLAEPIPVLAQLVAASPLEAAIHDAYGRALGANAYDLLGAEFVNTDLATYLGAEFRGEHLDRYTLRQPKSHLPLYHLVGALDPLTAGDIGKRIGDGLPETLGEWIDAEGLTHLKIKLNGDDLEWDVERVVAVEQVATEAQKVRGCSSWRYSLDFNERCAAVDYVLDFLARIEERSAAAFSRVHYIEQPTHRDLNAHPENRMHEAARIKPVVIDESLVDLESLLRARDLGYSGVALKACKGQSSALLMGAAAQKYGMFLCVQDLTCPGASFLHSASVAARVPTVSAIEGNARQYCPAGNRGWSERFPGMFTILGGTVDTSVLDGLGLGFEWLTRLTKAEAEAETGSGSGTE